MSPVRENLILPDWLDESFFRDIFEKRDDLQGKEFTLKVLEGTTVVEAGENYCSQMYRVKVQCDCEGQNNESSFIVKAAKSTVAFLKEQNFFAREFEMYSTVIGSFEEMWMKIGEPVSFGPKCLKVIKGELEILVFSDLKEEGFVMLDRLEGLNEDATLLVLERIAKFHASSVAYRERIGEFAASVQGKYIKEDQHEAMFRNYIEPKVKILAETVKEWGLGEKMSKLVGRWNEVMSRECLATTDPDRAPNDFHVLCHGDLWLNNLMFKIDEERDKKKVSEVMLIDFQISHWNRPDGDLFYFLVSSVAADVLVTRFDFFITFYHEKLLESLDKLSVRRRGPSLKKLQMQLLKNSFLIPRTIVCILPVISMDKSESVGIEELLGNADKERIHRMEWHMFHNPTIEKKLKLLLPFFYDRGMLDSIIGEGDELQIGHSV